MEGPRVLNSPQAGSLRNRAPTRTLPQLPRGEPFPVRAFLLFFLFCPFGMEGTDGCHPPTFLFSVYCNSSVFSPPSWPILQRDPNGASSRQIPFIPGALVRLIFSHSRARFSRNDGPFDSGPVPFLCESMTERSGVSFLFPIPPLS